MFLKRPKDTPDLLGVFYEAHIGIKILAVWVSKIKQKMNFGRQPLLWIELNCSRPGCQPVMCWARRKMEDADNLKIRKEDDTVRGFASIHFVQSIPNIVVAPRWQVQHRPRIFRGLQKVQWTFFRKPGDPYWPLGLGAVWRVRKPSVFTLTQILPLATRNSTVSFPFCPLISKAVKRIRFSLSYLKSVVVYVVVLIAVPCLYSCVPIVSYQTTRVTRGRI